jgi:hypothetical protein
MTEAIGSSETSVIRYYIPENVIVRMHRRENPKHYIALTSWALQRRRYVFPVGYELSSYIPEDVLHSHRRENLRFHIELTSWDLQRRRNVSSAKYELGFYIAEVGIPHSHCRENLKFKM